MTLVADQRLDAVRFEVVRATPVRDVRALLYIAAGERKYGERFLQAEIRKLELRRRYHASEAPLRGRQSWEQMRASSDAFWEEYQALNDLWMPEDPVYAGTRGGITLATTTDAWTYTSPSTGQARILESYVGGENTSSTVGRIALQRSTGGTTATNQTLEKMSTRSPTSVGTFATTWSAQPTLSGVALLFHAFNTFGGTDRWVSAPGEEIYQVNGELLSARSASGTPLVSTHAVLEEL